jgi:hypothetical protein
VYTPARRARLRELQRRLLLSLDGAVDYKQGSEIDAFFRQVAECAFLPDPDASVELAQLQIAILVEQVGRMVPHIEAALERFFRGFGQAAVDDLNRAVGAFLVDLEKLADEAWKAVQEFAAQLSAIGRAIEKAAQDLSNELARVEGVLASSRTRTEILSAVLLYGIDQAEAFARAIPGFDLLAPQERQLAVDTAVGTFRNAFNVLRPALSSALAVVGHIAGDISDVIDAATSLDDAVGRLVSAIRDGVEREVNRQLGIVGLALPQELGADDVARVARTIIRDLPAVRDALRACLELKQAKEDAEARRRDTSFAKARAESHYQRLLRDRDAETGGPVAVRLLAPAPLTPSPKFNWLYRGSIPVRLVIAGARPSFAEAGAKRRILLAMNGKPINPPTSSWSFQNNALRLNTLVPPSVLRRGMNLLECSVVDGRGNVVRSSVTFVWQPGVVAAALEVDTDSALTADPFTVRPVQSESLILVNRTGATVDLQGWSIADDERNRFVFPSLRVTPGASVTLISGTGPASDTTLYWQRRTPVWDDLGDTIYLVDPSGVLRTEYAFGSSR